MVKIGLSLMCAQDMAGGSFAGVLELAQLAERMGVDEVLVSDHVAISKTGYESKGGHFPYPIDFPGWYEPLSVLNAVAAVTSKVRLSTNVLVSTLRPAILLAKQIATLDFISNGRADMAFGVGWQKEEFDASEIPFEGRFGHVEEQILVCRKLWGEAPASFEGKRVSFKDFYSLPFPVQGSRIPICLGVAGTPRNFERMARVADGWFPSPLNGDEIAAGVKELHAAFKAAGRDPNSAIVRTALPMAPARTMTMDQQFAGAEKLVAAGATIVVGNPLVACHSKADWAPYIERLLKLKR